MTTPTSAEGFAAPYWAALEQEQLVIQRCTDCSELMPARIGSRAKKTSATVKETRVRLVADRLDSG